MYMVSKNLLKLIFLISAHLVFSQKDADINKTSNFDGKFSLVDIQELVDLKDRFEKAKKDKDYVFLTDYYRLQWSLYDFEKNLAVVDSAIYFAKLSKNSDLIGEVYLTKGRLFYIEKDYKKALDNYLISNDYLKNSSDLFLKHNLQLHLASIKAYLNESEDALSLFNQCKEYFSSQNDHKSQRLYLLTLSGINVVYYRIDDYKNLFKNNRLLFTESQRLKDDFFYNYSLIVLGYEKYIEGNYTDCINTVEEGLKYILENTDDFIWTGISYFHIGRSYWKLNESEKSLGYFHKVDSIFNKHQYADKTFRPMYELLINHHKALNNKTEQLYYVNQLLKLDSINNANYEYISPKIHKEYDTPKLLEEKHQLEQSFNKKSKLYNYIILFCSIFVFVLILYSIYLFKQKKSFKEKYNLLMANQPIPNKGDKTNEKIPFEIGDQTAQEILQKLRKFEEKKNFLQTNLTLNKLASQLKTNSSYLSKTINDIKGKTFSAYLNELRINYIIQLLKEEPKFRVYTIDAIAELAGFNTRQSFSKAFVEHTGIRPSYFLKEIQKET